MQRSTVTFLVLAALVGAAFAVALFSSGGTVPEPAPVPVEGAGPGEPTPVAPEGNRRDGVRVHVAVETVTAFAPPPAERVRAWLAGGAVELPVRLLAGEGAGSDARSVRAGLALVAIAHEGREVLRQVALPAEGVAEYRIGSRVVVRGSVLDERELPVRGARVWLGELGTDGARTEVETDATGAFETDAPAGDGVPFVVAADGRASHWQALTVAPPSPELRVVLQPGLRLDVQIAAIGGDLEAARVFVAPAATVATALTAYPFFAQALDDGHAVDGNGRAVVTGLPREGRVVVLARHPRASRPFQHEVALRGEAQRALVPVEFVASAVTGRVVDADGAALSGVAVFARERGRSLAVASSARLLPPRLPIAGVCTAITGGDGSFTVGLPPGADVVSLRRPGCAGLDVALPLPDEPIVLPAWRGGEPSFRLLPPAAGVAWTASTDLAGGIEARLGPDEAWLVSFPHAGRFTLRITTEDGEATATGTHANLDVTGAIEIEPPRTAR